MSDTNDIIAQAYAKRQAKDAKLINDGIAGMANAHANAQLTPNPAAIFMDDVRQSLERIETKLVTIERAVTALQVKSKTISGA